MCESYGIRIFISALTNALVLIRSQLNPLHLPSSYFNVHFIVYICNVIFPLKFCMHFSFTTLLILHDFIIPITLDEEYSS
jgi:hypothetical protein